MTERMPTYSPAYAANDGQKGWVLDGEIEIRPESSGLLDEVKEVFPVPTAEERQGIDTMAYPPRYAYRAGGRRDRENSDTISAAQSPNRVLWSAYVRYFVQGRDRCGPVFYSPGPRLLR
jgi:hypothetical protein